MILQKQVKGGILLYALLMLSVFSLLLQFYLRSQISHHRNHLALKESSQAYLMAELTMDQVAEELSKIQSPKPVEPPQTASGAGDQPANTSPSGDQPSQVPTPEPPSHPQPQEGEEPPETSAHSLKGILQFTSGQVAYEQMDESIQVQVRLQDGKVYRYSFPLSGERP